MTITFISDLHISETQPEIANQFIDFLENHAQDCDALYILGDLFEYWIGDDNPNPYYKNIILYLGKNGKKILMEVLSNWQFEYKEKKSLTNEESFLIKITNLKKINE